MSEPTVNPYVGPRTFEEQDAPFFFGRERESRELLSLVISEPIVLFYSQSGAGKSSLINARLIPSLRAEEFYVFPKARVVGGLPAGVESVPNIFIFNLLSSLDQNQLTPAGLSQLSLSEYLRLYKLQAAKKDETYYTSSGDERSRVLIIDQFEEIINTNLSHWQEREGFFQQLRQAIDDDPLLWVVLSLREDYVAALDPYARYLPGKMRARFYMQRMTAQSALEAIEKPAAQSGRPFEPEVAEKLVDNLRQLKSMTTDRVHKGQFIEPVQLQVVCYQLWEELQNRPVAPITQKDVDELGNVDKALAEFYEQALAKVIAERQLPEQKVRNWFERELITEAETRGTVYQGQKETAGLENEAVLLLANQFLIRSETRAGGVWYELVHDRFIAPILQANQAWRLRQSPLLRQAEEWDKLGRPREKLYRGSQLKAAVADLNPAESSPLIQQFLQASQDAQSQHDLEIARAQAAEQKKRAEEEARTADRFRYLTVGLVGMVFLALVALSWALISQNRANLNAQLASTSEAIAQQNVQTAVAGADQLNTRAASMRNLLDQAYAQSTLASDALAILENSGSEYQQLLVTATYQAYLLAEAAKSAEENLKNNYLATNTPSPTFTPTPTTSPTGTPDETVTAAAVLAQCVDGVTLVDDFTYNNPQFDGAREGVRFPMSWVLQNSGSCPWPAGSQWSYQGGNSLGVKASLPITATIQPGETITLTTQLVAPNSGGGRSVFSTWQLYRPDGSSVGQPIQFDVFIILAATPTSPPAPTTTPTRPVSQAPLEFNYFVQSCWYVGGSDWACTVQITPYGGSGSYTVFVNDSNPPRQYSGGNVTHTIQARRCFAWVNSIEVQDNQTGAKFSKGVYIDPATTNLFNGRGCVTP